MLGHQWRKPVEDIIDRAILVPLCLVSVGLGEGKGAGLVLPRCNTEGMTLHLADFSGNHIDF